MPPRAKKQRRAAEWADRKDRPLHERFAPKVAKDLKVHGPTVERVRAWLRRGAGLAPPAPGAEPRLLVLAGAPGVGKSACLDVLCQEEGLAQIRWRDVHGAGGDGWRDAPRRPTDFQEAGYESQVAAWRRFVRSARYAPLTGSAEHPGRAVLVLDDLPVLEGGRDGGGDGAARAAFRDALAEVCRSPGRLPAVLIASGAISEKAEARIVVERLAGDGVVASPHCDVVEFNAVTEKRIRAALGEVAAAAAWPRPAPADAALDGLAAAAQGDLRRALASLEVVLRGGRAPAASPADGGLSDLHAIGRVCRAKRDEAGALQFDPDRTVLDSKMGPDAFCAFAQSHAAKQFGDVGELAAGLAEFSAADVFGARRWQGDADRGDSIYPDQYVAALCGRAVAVHNHRPAPRTFEPIRKPRHYDVVAARKASRVDPNFLDAPPRLATAAAVLVPTGDDDADDADRRCLSDDDILDSEDEAPAPAPAAPVLSTDDFFNSW